MTHCSSTLTSTLFLVLACAESDSDAGSPGSPGSTGSSGEATTLPTTSGDPGPTEGANEDSTGGDPFSHAPVCSSDKYWTMGDLESPLMHPGNACLACHATQPEIADRLAIAGTVYPTGHEPDDCYGVDDSDAPIVVEITTADAKVFDLAVNQAGNFMYDIEEQGGAIAFPIKVRVVQGDRVRAMVSPQSTGDCNVCHTQDGSTGAPGRIVIP